MKRIAIVLSLLLSCLSAHAQQTQSSVQAQINAKIDPNDKQAITGAVLNGVLTTMNAATFQPLSSPVPLLLGGLGGSQAGATAGQVPVFPGSGGAAVPGNTISSLAVSNAGNTSATGIALGASNNLQIWQDGASGIIQSGLSNLYLRASDISHSVIFDTGKFAFAWPSSTYSMALGFPATFGQIYAGSSGTPITTNAPTIGISRREAISADSEGGQNAALYVESIGNNTSTGTSVIAEVNALTVFAQQLGTGDVAGAIFNSQQNGGTSATSYTAYGSFHEASALVAGTSATGIGLGVQNGTGTDQDYIPALGSSHPNTIGIDVAAIGSHLQTVGVYVHTDGAAGWDVGIGIPSGVLSADIRSDSSSADTFLDEGSHTHGINLVNGTYSSYQILAKNFTVDPGGNTVVNALTIGAGGLSINTTADPGAGAIYVNTASFLIRTKTSWTNGAGSSAGTITTAPSVGNPTKWIPVDDDGTTRYIPAW